MTFAETLRAGQGVVNAWSRLLGQMSEFTVPAFAPNRLYQNILSSMISGGNFSFLSTTVNQQKTDAPELEEEIVTRVASYGKQLGRLIEAVDVLAQRAKVDMRGDDRKKLNELNDLAEKISDARKRFARDNLDQILSYIGTLGRVGHVDHAALDEIKHLVDRLHKR